MQSGTTSTVENAFVVRFGQTSTNTADGFSLKVYQSPLKTLVYSISTQAWRLGQLLLMRYERQRDGTFVLFDLETTGTNTRTTEILELAALEIQGSTETDRSFHALSRPRGRISPHASQVHGISIDQVSDKPPINEVLPDYLEFLGEATLVGHNIAEFDYPVLRRIAGELGLPMPSGPIIDTCRLARRLLPDVSHRLQALASMFGYQETQTHRALDDVRLNTKVFFRLLDMLDRERELDIASETLELVALGIGASGVPLSDYNLWLAQAGGRAGACGLGIEFREQLNHHLISDADLINTQKWLHELPHIDVEEERRWNELDQRWSEVLERYKATFPDQSLTAFLDYVRLASTIDDHAQEDDRVTLMTIHSAKGKEWPLVFVVGAEDGSMPFYLARTKAELEEERRILYVAITRAKKRLCLLQVERSGKFRRKPGPFLNDLPDILLRHRVITK